MTRTVHRYCPPPTITPSLSARQGIELPQVPAEGFDTPERGDNARCDYERRREEEARDRLRKLVAGGGTSFKRVACACRAAQEGTKNCSFCRLCGSVSIDGRGVGEILISEGLAHTYVCRATCSAMAGSRSAHLRRYARPEARRERTAS